MLGISYHLFFFQKEYVYASIGIFTTINKKSALVSSIKYLSIISRIFNISIFVFKLSFELQVLPFIDGINHVAKIAAQADVDNNLVKTCLQNLV